MGLNFRGEANRLGKRNQHGFQEKSAPGPRQGQGGDQPGSLARAEKRFGNITSPAKIKKNFYGGEAYFQDGYSGDLGKSRPITDKSRSPLKINMALVDGAANTNKKFTDIGAAVADGFKDAAPEPKAANLAGNDNGKPKDKDPAVEGTGFKPTDTKSMFSKF
jgi:hypothetical protein|tara:strand:- start:106 stop:591 length:486 start_codon:yes stop_codon:yes gene_type:complete